MSTLEQAAPPPSPPPIPSGPRSPKTIGVGWLVLGIVLAILVVPAVLGGIAFVVAGDPDSDAAAIVAQAFFAAGLVAVPFIVCRIEGVAPAARRLGLRPFKPISGIGWMLATYGVFIGLAGLYSLLVDTQSEQQVLQDIGAEKDAVVLVAQGILVVGLAPVSEELFFRGFLFGGLRGKLSFWPAALISGLFFGSIHLLGGSWEVIPPLAAFGVLLAWLYERTGSLGPPVLMHALQNAIAFTITIS
ncbi:MAG TPA: type II CAAX endopeptidase family protein [Solirubrobacterales bacterium]